MSRIAVSIINYKTGDMTIAAVQSVLEDLGDLKADIIVVDNASGDGSDEQIAEWIARGGDPRVKLVRSETNTGFSGGHNQGMAAAPDAEYYLLLNSDTLLRPGFFGRVLQAAEADPRLGIFAPRLEFEDGTPQESCFRYPKILSEFIRGAESGPITRVLRRYEVPLGLTPRAKDIQWVSFACVLLRAKMVRTIGTMDEGYFLYFEDAEYCLRALRAGWSIEFVREARVVHFRGGSGPAKALSEERKRMPGYFWRSRARFLRQACGPFGPFLGNVAWLAGRSLAHFRPLVGKSVPASNESEWRDIWTNILKPMGPHTTGHR